MKGHTMIAEERDMKANTKPGLHKGVRHPPSILIIDDDVEAALIVATVFWQLNCNTMFVTDGGDAQRRLVGGKADLVILDWVLGEKLHADQVLEKCIHIIDKYRDPSRGKIKLITYSGLSEANIQLPQNQYFEHLAHWQKPINPRHLIKNIMPLIGGHS